MLYTRCIIIISPLQSTAGHRPLQLRAISLDLRLFLLNSCQPSCAKHYSTWECLLLRLSGPHLHSSWPSTSLQRAYELDRDRFSTKKPLCYSVRGASFHTKHAILLDANSYLAYWTRLPQRLSVLRLIWLAHYHFSSVQCTRCIDTFK
jgi:hypothetical protein